MPFILQPVLNVLPRILGFVNPVLQTLLPEML